MFMSSAPNPSELKHARELMGMSQKEAAKHIGVSLNCYNGWEKGRHVPREGSCGALHTFIAQASTPALPSPKPVMKLDNLYRIPDPVKPEPAPVPAPAPAPVTPSHIIDLVKKLTDQAKRLQSVIDLAQEELTSVNEALTSTLILALDAELNMKGSM